MMFMSSLKSWETTSHICLVVLIFTIITAGMAQRTGHAIMGTLYGSHEYLGGHLGGQIYHSLEHDKIQAEI